MVDLHSSREAGSAQGPPSATERRECKSRVALLLMDADSAMATQVKSTIWLPSPHMGLTTHVDAGAISPPGVACPVRVRR